MSEPSPHTLPKMGQKFKNTINGNIWEFERIVKRGSCSPYEWLFMEDDSPVTIKEDDAFQHIYQQILIPT